MLRYILLRLLAMIPTLFLISVLVFIIIELPPGDYFESYVNELKALGEEADLAEIEELKAQLRLRPARADPLPALGGRDAAGRFRLFLRIPPAGERGGGRPAVADDACCRW